MPHLLIDLIGCAGLAAISYGAWLVYVPAGFIVGGLLATAFAALTGRRIEARKS